MPKKIDEELRARAVRLVMEHRSEYPTMTAAVHAVAKQVGVGKESVRRWVAQAEVDTGARPGTTTKESVEVKRHGSEATIGSPTHHHRRSGGRCGPGPGLDS